MTGIPTGVLVGFLVLMVVVSGFFSASETAMMTLNRYRMRCLANQGHSGALRAMQMLKRPDRLLGLILLGNNFVNVLAATVAAIIGSRLLGDLGIAVSPFLLTPLMLIFAELAPKTVAVLYPERLAFPSCYILYPLSKLFYPITISLNYIANRVLAIFGISTEEQNSEQLNIEEVRSLLAHSLLSQRYRKMLPNILELEQVTVEDIMVPRNAIIGIDLNDDASQIWDRLRHSEYSKLPLYRDDINHIEAVLHLHRAIELPHDVQQPQLAEYLVKLSSEPYCIPASTSLNAQLHNFQQQQHLGLIVDEYGDIQGLITLNDLLGEIVGEFTGNTDPRVAIHPQADGTYLIDGNANIRELNRIMEWELPTDGPKTLNGLVLEQLETIPEKGVSLLIAGYPVEIVQTVSNAVKIARIKPALRRSPLPDD